MVLGNWGVSYISVCKYRQIFTTPSRADHRFRQNRYRYLTTRADGCFSIQPITLMLRPSIQLNHYIPSSSGTQSFIIIMTTSSPTPVAPNPPATTAITTTTPTATSPAYSLTPAQRTLEARVAFTTTLTTLGSSISHNLSLIASDIHTNSSSLTSQESLVTTSAVSLRKETDKYNKAAEQARGRLKELGDIQNWAEVLERDLLVLEETVREGEEREREMERGKAGLVGLVGGVVGRREERGRRAW